MNPSIWIGKGSVGHDSLWQTVGFMLLSFGDEEEVDLDGR